MHAPVILREEKSNRTAIFICVERYCRMREPREEGVNPAHISQLWENTWRLLEDPVKIYLAATCHSKSAPATVQEIMILAAWVLVSLTRECHILIPSKN